MSTAVFGPVDDSARTTSNDEPTIESNGCGSKAEPSSSVGQVTATDNVNTTKIPLDKVFDSVSSGVDAEAKLARDPIAIPTERDNSCDKEVLTCSLPSP